MAGRFSGSMFAAALLLLPPTAAGQMTMRPTAAPLVTAENERWFVEGAPITYGGSFYYPAGAQTHFNPYEMVRSGNFEGIPFYTKTTLEPYSVLFVPIGGGLMQPYERRRDGDAAGTVGSTVPSFPVRRDSEVTGAYFPQAGVEPFLRYSDADYLTDEPAPRQMAPTATTGANIPSQRPVVIGPMRSALSPKGYNSFYIDHDGRRWFNSGPAVELEPATFTRKGDYHGFPVYVGPAGADTIYVAVAGGASGLLTPSSLRK